MALLVSQRARLSYVEISNFLRSSRAAPLHVGGRKPRNFIQPKYVDLKKRSIHQARYLRSEQEARGLVPEMFEKYMDSLVFPKATHEIRNLPNVNPSLDTKVIVHGYLGESVNLSKNLCIMSLISKDLSCSIQIISFGRSSEGKQVAVHEKLKNLRPHTPVVVTGSIKTRAYHDGGSDNSIDKINTVEVVVSEVQPLNVFPTNIIAKPETVFPPEQRHLQLRTDRELRKALAVRAKAAMVCREELGNKQGFTEVETPLLFKSTSEGAREFIVPTRQKGMAYALPQSPQQFKQILMGSGISKYYQFAKCFRDEDLRSDRQPEFTQLDLEMSFSTGADVMECVENLIRKLWKEVIDVDLRASFPRITYDEAMSKYGSDKPDLRPGMPIHRIEHLLPKDLIRNLTSLPDPVVEMIIFQSGQIFDLDSALSRKFITTFLDSPEASPFQSNPSGAPGVFTFDPKQPLQGFSSLGFEAATSLTTNFPLDPADILIIQARPNIPHSGGSTPLGNIRLALHKAAVTSSLIPPHTDFFPLWITHFPLFTPTATITTSSHDYSPIQQQQLTSTHHPFTSPLTPNDVSLLSTNPALAIADHYDLVINGTELGGGSRRIHHFPIQSYIFTSILKLPAERVEEFSHLLEVLRAGCPPHAGFALGFDRLVAVMLARGSVRDVIAFPKSSGGYDGLVGAPAKVREDVLETYHLKVRDTD